MMSKPATAPARNSNGNIKEISVARAAKILDCGADTIYRLLESGAIRGYQWRPRGWWRIYSDSLVDFMERIQKGTR